ncbi:hypothetical protein LBMAG56_40660 [Verrucomicrobiota bacterium]|nr:hypothetical protein LBMAG56_40660 [Verrucomicrobiota bacterium]
MIKSFFADLLVDPRKLLVAGFLLSLATMGAHVMDCEFVLNDYLFLVLCIALLLPLFSLGKVDPVVDITISNRLALIFLGSSVALVAYNISQIGAPLLLQKILQGESLEKQYGFYYHHQFKLSFLVWSLFTVLIPMAFFVQSRWLAVVMVAWSVIMSTLIQIKLPFLFGFLYAALLFRLTRRKLRVVPLAIVGALLMLLFVFVNSTRTSQDLTEATYDVGLSESWSRVDPIVWGPVAYLATPVANALLTIQYEPFRFDIDGILKVLPAIIVEPMGLRYSTAEKFPRLQYVRWYEASNIIAGWGHLANNMGVIGMLAFNAGVASLLVVVARKNFWAQPFLLAFFLVGCRCCALYAVEDYFFEPTTLSEFLLLSACFHWSLVNYHAVPLPEVDGIIKPADVPVAPAPVLVASVGTPFSLKMTRRKSPSSPPTGSPPRK